MLKLFNNPYFLGFLGVYALAVATLAASGAYSIAEPMFMLVIFGILLPGVAVFMCRKTRPLPVRIHATASELFVVLACVVFTSGFLVWGGDRFDALVYRFIDETPRFDYGLDIAKKLVVFVAIPWFLLSRLFGYSWSDFGFSTRLKTVFAPPYLALMVVFFVLYFLIQALIGQAAQPVFKGAFSTAELLLGSLLLYPLLMLKVGLVEEFFFRAVVQARIAVWLKSEVAGLFLMALVFGLAHAPGIYLRGAGAVTALGETPTLLQAVAYSIAVPALAGLAFGVIWARTKNLLVLIMIHAWVDLLPLLPEFIGTFGIAGNLGAE